MMHPMMHLILPNTPPHTHPWRERRLWKHYLSATTVVDGKNLTEFVPVTLRHHEMLLILAQHMSPVQFYLPVLIQMVQRNLGPELDADPVLSQVHQRVAELFLVQGIH